MYVLVLLSAPTMVKPQCLHRAIPVIINQSSDSKENTEKQRSISDTNNRYSDKLREVKKLREKRIDGVRDRLEGLGIQWNPIPYSVRTIKLDFIHSCIASHRNRTTSISFYRPNLNGHYRIYFCNLIIIFCTER
jgi:hypothetical protein